MRKIIVSLIASIFLFSSCMKWEKRIGADHYADSIINYQNQTLTQIDTFFQSLFYPDYDAVDYYWKAINQLKMSHYQLTEIGEFKSDDLLYNGSLDYFHLIDDLLSVEGKKLLELHEIRDTYGNTQWRKEIDSLLRSSFHILNSGRQTFDSTLTIFLDNHGFDVVVDTSLVSKSNFDQIPAYSY